MAKILVAEISGKRPGGDKARPTERFNWDFDKVIISNNSDGYITDWPIVDVPQDYQQWYRENVKTNDLAYYAPMNRSYAIKYAREHGYDYLVQLDDNIISFNIRYRLKDGRSYTTLRSTPGIEDLPNDMIRYMAKVLDNTNAGLVGMTLAAGSVPGDDWLTERYCYSAFVLNLKTCPSLFQGDFEDDIEYRLKMQQLKIPSVQVSPFQYVKTAQSQSGGQKEDLTGNRKAYSQAGLERGATMARIHGDVYSRGWSSRGSGTTRKQGQSKFRHKIKPFKVGVLVKDYQVLKTSMADLLVKYVTPRQSKLKVITKRKG